MTRVTAYAIRNTDNDIRVCPFQNKATRKWGATMDFLQGGDLHYVLMTAAPIFETEAAAETALNDVMAEVRAIPEDKL